MQRRTFFALASLLTLLAAPAFAAGTAPLRHLAFSYEMSTTSTIEQQGSGLSDTGGQGGSAIQRSTARQSGKGTIDADVLAATQDGGLVVSTSEQGDERVPATQIAIKGDGTILTGAQGSLSEEQRYVLALLGRNIMPFTQASVGQTWKVTQETAKGSSDVTTFRIASIDDPIVHLSVTRVVTAMSGYELTITGTVDYDYKRVVPTAGRLESVSHSQTASGLNTTDGLLTFSLAQDSFAKPNG